MVIPEPNGLGRESLRFGLWNGVWEFEQQQELE
jgi:hypothetical protein